MGFPWKGKEVRLRSLARLWFFFGLGTFSYADTAEIYHEKRSLKKESAAALNPFSNINDDDIHEQIQVYGAEDEGESLNTLYEPKMLRPVLYRKIERTQIEVSGARTLLDLLKDIAEFEVFREVSGYYLVSSRGLRGDARIQLLVDGFEASNPYSGRNYWQIPADLIEAVEIYQSAPELSMGPGALGTNINVIMRKKKGVAGRLYGGSFSTFSMSASTGLQTPWLQAHLSAQVQTEEGPRLTIEADKYSPRAAGRNRGELHTVASRLSGAIAAGADFTLSKFYDIHLSANAQGFLENRGPYIGAFDTSGPNSNLFWSLWKADVNLRIPYGRQNELMVSAYANQNHTLTDFQLTPAPFASETAQGVGTEVFADGILSHQKYYTLMLGGRIINSLRLFKENVLNTSISLDVNGLLRDSFVFEMNQSIAGGIQPMGAVDSIDVKQNEPCNMLGLKSSVYGGCRLVLNATIEDVWKFERRFLSVVAMRIFSSSSVAFDISTFASPMIGLLFSPNTAWKLKLVFNSGLRIPTIEEQYDQTKRAMLNISQDQFLGNQDLSPEHSKSIDFNVNHRQIVGATKYEYDASIGAAIVGNVIEKVDLKGDVNGLSNAIGYYNVNAGMGLRAEFSNSSSLFANISWTRSYWREIDGTSFITNLPQLRANLGAVWWIGGIASLFINAQFASERRNNVRSDLERQRQYRISPYGILNATLRSNPILRHIVLEASIFNVFNLHVKDDVMRPDYLPGLVPRDSAAFYLGLSIIND